MMTSRLRDGAGFLTCRYLLSCRFRPVGLYSLFEINAEHHIPVLRPMKIILGFPCKQKRHTHWPFGVVSSSSLD